MLTRLRRKLQRSLRRAKQSKARESRWMKNFRTRLPDRRSIIGVYAAAVFLVYGWTLLASFWKVPSWMFFLKVGEILSVYAYSFVIDLAESILLLFTMLLIGILLPKNWWNDQFTSKGIVWISVLLGSILAISSLSAS